MGLTMKEKQAVTREYGPRYRKAGKKAKSALLNEFIRLTGYHRKSAVRLLNARPVRQVLVYGKGQAVKIKPEQKRPANRAGKRAYTEEVVAALRLVWAFFWHKCGKILAPLMRQQMRYIAQWPAFHITGDIAEKLARISPATIDRRLKKDKDARLRGKSLTKPPDSLTSRIPIRTFYTAEERRTPGFWQIDTVHHCGQATAGQYVHPLTATEVSSGWIELRALLNNAHRWTFAALSDIAAAVPLPVVELHSDNGSEFINHATEIWCAQTSLPFTRSRDHCFVEQKNGAVVREYAGYDRLEGLEEQALLAAVYAPLAPLLNFFMPTQKLAHKARVGSKEIKVYDEPRSPFHRLLENEGLPQELKDTLAAQCALYNPVELQQNVNKAILRLRRRLAQPNRLQSKPQD
jgi:transposase InsO family protein